MATTKTTQQKPQDRRPQEEGRLTVHQERQQRSSRMLHDLDKMAGQFQAALPAHITPEKFKRTCITAYNSNPDLIDADPRTFLQAVMKCAQDGLVPDGRQAALVIFKGKVQYMPMIGGVIERASRTGEIASITAQVAYENDTFRVVLGDEERIEHEMALKDRGEAVAAYAIVKTKSGGIYREVMTVEDIEDVRAISRAKDDGPWVTWWGEMARKTVLRRLLKKVPSSSELMRMLDRDNYQYDLDNRRPASLGPSAAEQLEVERKLPPEAFELVDMTDDKSVIQGQVVDTGKEPEKVPVEGNGREQVEGLQTKNAIADADRRAGSGSDRDEDHDNTFPGDR